jgi:exosome complex component RRP4
VNPMEYVTTGDVINTDTGYLRGHGTQVSGVGRQEGEEGKEELLATVSGFVERVNKLVSVRALNSRYQGEIGDVIVGRIVEVADRRWRVDVASRQHSVLMLSSVNLPGGVQRRRTYEDSLQMREFFSENDLISAEVQKLMGDGAISLHTRNLKYGKLEGGQFLRVPSSLIKRCKQHFHTLECGVDAILGNNGYVWLEPTPPQRQELEYDEAAELSKAPKQPATPEQREKICRVRNSILALSQMHIAIYKETIMDVYVESVNLGLAAKSMLNPDVLQRVTQVALARQQSRR